MGSRVATHPGGGITFGKPPLEPTWPRLAKVPRAAAQALNKFRRPPPLKHAYPGPERVPSTNIDSQGKGSMRGHVPCEKWDPHCVAVPSRITQGNSVW